MGWTFTYTFFPVFVINKVYPYIVGKHQQFVTFVFDTFGNAEKASGKITRSY